MKVWVWNMQETESNFLTSASDLIFSDTGTIFVGFPDFPWLEPC